MQPEYNPYTASTNNRPINDIFSRRNIVIALVIILVLVFSWLGWDQLVHKKIVTLRPTNGISIQIGTPGDSDNGQTIDHVLFQSSTEKSVRLEPGNYEVLYSGADYLSQYSALTLTANVILTPPKLAYSPNKLGSLLNSSKSDIHTVLAASTDLQTNGYTEANEKLYDDGTWYAAQLIPADQVNQDRLVVIMHKVNGTWKLVAGPKIVLSIADYPHIPDTIIRTINNLPYGQ